MRLLTGFDRGGRTPAHGNSDIGFDVPPSIYPEPVTDRPDLVDPSAKPARTMHYRLRRPISWSFVLYAAWKAVVWFWSSNNRSESVQYTSLRAIGHNLLIVGPGHPMFFWAILWTITSIYLSYSLIRMTREAATRGLLVSGGMNAAFSFSLSWAAFSNAGTASFDTLGTLLLVVFFHILALYLTWAEW